MLSVSSKMKGMNIFTRFFSWLFSRVSGKSLQNLAIQKQKNEWEKRLKLCVVVAKKSAKQGNTSLIIKDQVLRCQYNLSRPRDQILSDVQKRFPKCNVYFASIEGSTTIEVRWDKVKDESK